MRNQSFGSFGVLVATSLVSHTNAFATYGGDKVTIQSVVHPGAIRVSTNGTVSVTAARAVASVYCPTDGYRPNSLGEQSWNVYPSSSNVATRTVNATPIVSDALKKKLVEACKTRLAATSEGGKIQSTPMTVAVPVSVPGTCKKVKFTMYGTPSPAPASSTVQVPVDCEGIPTYTLPSLTLSTQGTSVQCNGAADEIVWIIAPAGNPKAGVSQPGKCPGSIDLSTGPAALVGTLKVKVGAKYTPKMPGDEFHAVGNEVEITVLKKK